MPFLEKFTGRAAAYSAGRPSYPRGILDMLANEIGFDSTKIVADIGSGTGILSKLSSKMATAYMELNPTKKWEI